ncbi:hypothetical protein [Actinomadura sp. 9N215]|uniref:hypothetical protein n=1 Tax=Actinomadura sp. 9N215 TaxID=3375150 RepID=UPI00379F21E0
MTIASLEEYAIAADRHAATLVDKTDFDLLVQCRQVRRDFERDRSNEDARRDSLALAYEVHKRCNGDPLSLVQLIAVAAMQRGETVEMRSVDLQDVVIDLAAGVWALGGKNVHVVVLNDEFALRRSSNAARVLEKIGLLVSVLHAGMGEQDRGQAYRADVVYGSPEQFSQDYLFDNMTCDSALVRQQGHGVAILDEIESILVDKAEQQQVINTVSETQPVTLARVSVHDYFRLYTHLLGASSRASKYCKELCAGYGLTPVSTSTENPSSIKVKSLVHSTSEEKCRSLLDDVRKTLSQGWPVIVAGARDVDVDLLKEVLNEHGIAYVATSPVDPGHNESIMLGSREPGRVVIVNGSHLRGVHLADRAHVSNNSLIAIVGQCGSRRADSRVEELLSTMTENEIVRYVDIEDLAIPSVVWRLLGPLKSMRIVSRDKFERAFLKQTYEMQQAFDLACIDGWRERNPNDSFEASQRMAIYSMRRRVLTVPDPSVLLGEVFGSHAARGTEVLERRIAELGAYTANEVFRQILLSRIDRYWSLQLTVIDELTAKLRRSKEVSPGDAVKFSDQSYFKMVDDILVETLEYFAVIQL